ncbi:MAG: LysR substrate-binding domain-containing protein, partial [Marinobacter alexandrii]
TISVTPTFAAKWLIPNLPNLTALHPEIDLRVLATDSVLSFHGDGIDLAIRQGAPPFGAAIDARLLFHSDIVAIAAPTVVQGRDLPLAAHAFGELPLLQDMHDLWPAFLRDVLGVRDWVGKNRLSFSQTSLSIDAALAGQGIALASRFLVEQDFLAGRLVEVAGGSFNGGRDFHLLAQKNATRRQAVTAVMEWLLGKSEVQS